MKVVHEIKRRGIPVVGMMIGSAITDADRKYKQDLDSFIHENRMEQDIYAPGFRSDIADILAATDCVVVPSSEGMPLTMLEAMSEKTRVVGMDTGGSYEVLRKAKCGECFPVNGSEKDIANAVLRAMEQSDSVLENGYRFCLQNNYKNYSKGLHRVFECMK